jgi:quercetin dioxygenase-like cupin family protein
MRSLALSFLLVLAVAAWAQDPVEVDAKHYKVMFENDAVRVIKISYGPGEKSVMHDHPAGVAVFLTDHHVKFNLPDGRSEEGHGQAGDAVWAPAGKHLPENIGSEALALILVELKDKAAQSQ